MSITYNRCNRKLHGFLKTYLAVIEAERIERFRMSFVFAIHRYLYILYNNQPSNKNVKEMTKDA